MIAAALVVLAAQVATPVAAATMAATVPVEIAEPDPKQMSRGEINKFTAKLARTHPYFIRCVRSGETGSLVKKSYSCRTNEKWVLADRVGSENARETLDAMKGKSLSGN